MATVASKLSLEEFHRLYDGEKPEYEFWYGEAIQKPMGTFPHSGLQAVFITLLLARGWKPFPEVRLKLAKGAEPIPDVIASRRKMSGEYPTAPFELAIEILSPDQRILKILEKGRVYLSWGISNVWIIDPVSRKAWMQTDEIPEGLAVDTDGTLLANDGLAITLVEIFEQLDRYLE